VGSETVTGAWDGSSYAGIAELQREMARRSIAELHLKGDEQVLDVGCGDGGVTACLAELVPAGRVLGVDLSSSQIAFAQEQFGRPGLSFALADAATLDFEAEFDLVFSANALHWVHDLASAFAGLQRALRPAGRIVLRFVCAGERRSIEDELAGLCEDERFRDLFDGFEQPFEHRRPDELQRLAVAAGLEVAVEVDHLRWDFGSRALFARWCQGTMAPWFERLPPERHDSFVSALLAAYEAGGNDPGVFHFEQCCIVGRRR